MIKACNDHSYMNPGELSYKEEEEISDFENNVNPISNKYVWVGDDTEDINLHKHKPKVQSLL